MILHALHLPDDPAQLPAWLERQLLGLDLAALVAELLAVHGPAAAPADSVRTLLGDHLDGVLHEGLAALPPPLLRQLLLQPYLLLELQELILTAGGSYWDHVERSTEEIGRQVERGRQRLQALLNSRQPETAAPRLLRVREHPAWYRRPWLVSFATAAAVLLGVYLYQEYYPPEPLPAVAQGWGWNQPGALSQDVKPDVYLNRLADAANQWFNKRPETAPALAQRIGEFRQGCSTLIFAEHRPLAAADKQWLVERCRAWAEKFDKHLSAVEAGQDPLQARAETDATVNKLIDALRTRAREVAAVARHTADAAWCSAV